MTSIKGSVVALSISDAPDRGKLGYPSREVDRALMSISMAIVRAGADVLYSGDLRPTGYTFKLFRHLAGAYAGEDHVPFINLLPEPVVRRTSFDDLCTALKEQRGTARTLLGVRDGLLKVRLSDDALLIGESSDQQRLADASAFDGWVRAIPPRPNAEGYTAARRAAAEMCKARVCLGGKMGIVANTADHYEGDMPGIIEEAIWSLEAGNALIPLGAFGGSTRDLAIALDLLDKARGVPRGPQNPTYDTAIQRLERMRSKVPTSCLVALRSLAIDDRIDYIAREVREVIEMWP